MASNSRVTVGALGASALAVMAVIGFEGYSDTAYLDSVGVPTIGHGTTYGVKLGDKVTRIEAQRLLHRDLTYAGDAIKRCVKVPLYQHEYDAYSSLAYNIGGGAFCKSTLVRKLNTSDYIGACNEFPRWVYAGGKKLRGLEIRRAKEQAMCLTGATI